jgi:hypothetical protein
MLNRSNQLRAGEISVDSVSLAGRSILIVEDEPLIALNIAESFHNAGASVMTAHRLQDVIAADPLLEQDAQKRVAGEVSANKGHDHEARDAQSWHGQGRRGAMRHIVRASVGIG